MSTRRWSSSRHLRRRLCDEDPSTTWRRRWYAMLRRVDARILWRRCRDGDPTTTMLTRGSCDDVDVERSLVVVGWSLITAADCLTDFDYSLFSTVRLTSTTELSVTSKHWIRTQKFPQTAEIRTTYNSLPSLDWLNLASVPPIPSIWKIAWLGLTYSFHDWTHSSSTAGAAKTTNLQLPRVKKWLNFPYFRTPLANFLLSHPNSVEYRTVIVKQLHCCPRLDVRVQSSKVELAAAGVHPDGMISSHASI